MAMVDQSQTQQASEGGLEATLQAKGVEDVPIISSAAPNTEHSPENTHALDRKKLVSAEPQGTGDTIASANNDPIGPGAPPS